MSKLNKAVQNLEGLKKSMQDAGENHERWAAEVEKCKQELIAAEFECDRACTHAASVKLQYLHTLKFINSESDRLLEADE